MDPVVVTANDQTVKTYSNKLSRIHSALKAYSTFWLVCNMVYRVREVLTVVFVCFLFFCFFWLLKFILSNVLSNRSKKYKKQKWPKYKSPGSRLQRQSSSYNDKKDSTKSRQATELREQLEDKQKTEQTGNKENRQNCRQEKWVNKHRLKRTLWKHQKIMFQRTISFVLIAFMYHFSVSLGRFSGCGKYNSGYYCTKIISF